MVSPKRKIFRIIPGAGGKTGNSERQVSAMQDQGHGQKSRNQAPDPRTEPQAGRMQNKKKDQPQDKEGKTQRY